MLSGPPAWNPTTGVPQHRLSATTMEKEREQILGIRIPLERNCAIVGKFEGTGDTKKKSVPKPENVMKSEEPKLIEKKAEVTVEAVIPMETGKRQAQTVKESVAVTENTLHMKDTKWEQLSSIYPHIHPFRDAREFLSVGPEDFVVLRERCYQMTHNSFLLHDCSSDASPCADCGCG